MTIQDAIYSYLSTYSGLTALVSTRIYPIMAPQGAAAPHVIFYKASGNSVHTMSTDPRLGRSSFSFSCYATTPEGAQAVATAIRDAMRDQGGQTWGAVDGAGGLYINSVLTENEVELADETTGWFCVVLDFEIYHPE